MASWLYIDGLSLYYGSVRGTAYRWLDLEAVADGLKLDPPITRIHYFATPDPDPEGQARQATYLRALRTLRRVRVHEVQGTHPVAELSQKLLEDEKAGRFRIAAVLTNDGRLAEPISRVRPQVCIVLPRQRKLADRAVRDAGNFRRKLGVSILSTSLLPDELEDEEGQIVKPEGW